MTHSNVAAKPEPTPLGLPFEIRQVIWDLTKPTDSFNITLPQNYQEDPDYHGCAAEGLFDAAPLLLVNRQFHQEVREIRKRKVTISFLKDRLPETHFMRLSLQKRNLVTDYALCRWRLEWLLAENLKIFWESEMSIYHPKIEVFYLRTGMSGQVVAKAAVKDAKEDEILYRHEDSQNSRCPCRHCVSFAARMKRLRLLGDKPQDPSSTSPSINLPTTIRPKSPDTIKPDSGRSFPKQFKGLSKIHQRCELSSGRKIGAMLTAR